MELRDCTDAGVRGQHLTEAVRQLADGHVIVLPTDTVYGIGADAFTPKAVAALLKAKGRGRQMPPPVLIGTMATLDGLAAEVPDAVRDLVEEFWPGGLTVIVRCHPSLHWDLGETHGTVALRMPDHEVALELLRRTGPLAVSSANRSGQQAALTCAEAADQLGDAVRVYLDAGPTPGGVASTIVDATGDSLKIVREGAITAAELGSIAPELLPPHVPEVIDDGAAVTDEDPAVTDQDSAVTEDAPSASSAADSSDGSTTDDLPGGSVS